MQNSIMNLNLNGQYANCNVQTYNAADDLLLRSIYQDWRSLSGKLLSLGGRRVNLPEGLSEPVFCRAMNAIRVVNVSGASGSFDAYNPSTSKRIQVKGSSILPDLTSFGPQSVWDELYFMDFYQNGTWNGQVDIYLIPNHLIYNTMVNKKQTMQQQQAQGKRPRFSIYKKIIRPYQICPVLTHQI